jgi:hypothetical protein
LIRLLCCGKKKKKLAGQENYSNYRLIHGLAVMLSLEPPECLFSIAQSNQYGQLLQSAPSRSISYEKTRYARKSQPSRYPSRRIRQNAHSPSLAAINLVNSSNSPLDAPSTLRERLLEIANVAITSLIIEILVPAGVELRNTMVDTILLLLASIIVLAAVIRGCFIVSWLRTLGATWK